MAKNDAVQQYGAACSRRACARVELAADPAALMRIMMAASAELISRNSFLVKTHLYIFPGIKYQYSEIALINMEMV